MLFRALLMLAVCQQISAQSVGDGVSKSTYSTSDPVAAWNWMNKYLKSSSGDELVCTPSDECTDNVCDCAASGSTPEWKIQQGRVFLLASGSTCSACSSHAGCGFGLHHVNVSNHLTTGGLSTAEVETYFTTKLADMDTRYDSFLDYNVVLSTSELSYLKKTFAADGVKTHTGTWSSGSLETSYTSLLVHVPNTQMVIEFVQEGTFPVADGESAPTQMEQRVSDRALASIDATSTVFAALAVNRAASEYAISKIEDFYTGMGATVSLSSTGLGATGTTTTKKCILWPGATTEVCYTNRADTETKGDWKVCNFEDSLNTVHNNLMLDNPMCGQDKWEDNHYAIDSRTVSTSKIASYIDSAKPYHYCEATGSSTSLHYVWDPTGWGIQLDISPGSAPSDCSSRRAGNSRRLLQPGKGGGGGGGGGGTSNPACTASTECATPSPTAITSACSGVSPTPTPPSPTPPSPTPPSPTPPSPTPDTGSGKSSWVSDHWYILAIAGVVVVLGGAGIYYWKRGEMAVAGGTQSRATGILDDQVQGQRYSKMENNA